MNRAFSSPFDLWVKRALTATLLALVAALLAVGLVLYGPGARAQGLAATERPLATKGDDR